jgi:aarF domain-containing kinase
MATGIRFFHLVFIFFPVMAAVPAMWFGRRVQGRNGERSGTLWWFDFLVCSMERAGPAFIKVRNFSFSFLFIPNLALRERGLMSV